ncbi:predicted protein [Streptomyces sp. AA4]|nr:predicted protein [Streptomyces sp. AA4]
MDRPAEGTGHGSEFAELSALVKDAGLFRRRPVHYLVRGAAALLAFGGAWVLLALGAASWWQLGTAALLAVGYTQLSFLGHDAGHKQIFRGRRANDATGTALAALVGLSYGWWVGKHTRHHANPNLEESDPDIDIPALAFSARQSRAKAGFLRWMAKYQAFLFFPLLLLEGVDLHWSGIKAVRHGGTKSPQARRDPAGRPRRRLSHGRVSLAAAGNRRGVHRGPPRRLGCLHGMLVRAQPQGDAAPGTRAPPGLPPPPSADVAQRPRRPLDDVRAGRAELPNRAPPFPEHPDGDPAPGTAAGAGLLPGPRDQLQPGRTAAHLRGRPAASAPGRNSAPDGVAGRERRPVKAD